MGATENIVLAAVKARGVTVLQNAAKEPEIISLCEFLTKAGAIIEGTGTDTLLIKGLEERMALPTGFRLTVLWQARIFLVY